jgi:hypothetical protein
VWIREASSFEWIYSFPFVRELILIKTDICYLPHLKALERLTLQECPKIGDISHLTQLNFLKISCCLRLCQLPTALAPDATIILYRQQWGTFTFPTSNIHKLHMIWCHTITNVSILSKVKHLFFSFCTGSLGGLNKLTCLKTLRMEGHSSSGIEFILRAPPSLRRLELWQIQCTIDITHVRSVRHFVIESCPKIYCRG